jgi:hypothetical protein
MGNYSIAQSARQREAVTRSERFIAERDAKFPAIERPCGTPGAVYTIVVEGDDLGVLVRLPFNIEQSLPADAQQKLKAEIHDAILPVIETFYRRVWDKTIAGKKIGDDPDPMPKRWELLFTKWLKRCFERGTSLHLEGREISNRHMLPERYRWW